MGRTTQTTPETSPAVTAVLVALAYAILIAVGSFGMASIPWWAYPLIAVVFGIVSIIATMLQSNARGRPDGWGPAYGYRFGVWIVLGGWATWTAYRGPNFILIGAGLGLLVGLCMIGNNVVLPAPAPPRTEPEPVRDNRPADVRLWEARLRKVTKWLGLVVRQVIPWERPEDGLRLVVELPDEEGTTTEELAKGNYAAKLAAAARLADGCAVEISESGTQGVAFVDVMLRPTLRDPSPIHVEPTTRASINDPFPVMVTPRGKYLSICLRFFSAIIGGTTGSGKTTLLHRIIMYLARCTDTLIWVIDVAGGGIAEPWITPWAERQCARPVVDWLADNDAEAAVMVAVLLAILRDRKVDPEIIRRMRDGNTFLMPASDDLPAILVLTDEGGDLHQTITLLAQAASAGLSRIVQLGRAMGVRVIMSVLRGTADLTDKALRVHTAIRICLRMRERTEYGHVLDADPPKVSLGGAPGPGFLRTDEIETPVLGRTLDVDRASITAHAIACSPLRPKLNDRARDVARRVTVTDVCGGRECPEELLDLPALIDVENGEAYEGRWRRQAAKLAELRGETVVYVEPVRPARRPAGAAPAAGEDALDTLHKGVKSLMTGAADDPAAATAGPVIGPGPVIGAGPADGAVVYDFPSGRHAVTPAPTRTARQRLYDLLDAAGPDGMSTSEACAALGVSTSLTKQFLREYRDREIVMHNAAGRNILVRHAQTVVPTA